MQQTGVHQPRSHRKSRLFLALLFVGLGIPATVDGVAAQLVGRSLLGLALIMMGVFSYLQPIDLRAAIGRGMFVSPPPGIGSVRVRAILSVSMIVCLSTGLLCRFVLEV